MFEGTPARPYRFERGSPKPFKIANEKVGSSEKEIYRWIGVFLLAR